MLTQGLAALWSPRVCLVQSAPARGGAVDHAALLLPLPCPACRPVDADLARELREFRSPTDGETRMFYEIVIAPGYTPEGLEVLKGKSKTVSEGGRRGPACDRRIAVVGAAGKGGWGGVGGRRRCVCCVCGGWGVALRRACMRKEAMPAGVPPPPQACSGAERPCPTPACHGHMHTPDTMCTTHSPTPPRTHPRSCASSRRSRARPRAARCARSARAGCSRAPTRCSPRPSSSPASARSSPRRSSWRT